MFFQVGGKIFQVGGISFQAACRFFYRPPFSAQVGGCRGGRPARGGVGVWGCGLPGGHAVPYRMKTLPEY
jgi:hypothetical protein